MPALILSMVLTNRGIVGDTITVKEGKLIKECQDISHREISRPLLANVKLAEYLLQHCLPPMPVPALGDQRRENSRFRAYCRDVT